MYLLEASLIPNGLALLRLALEQYIKFLAGKEVLLLDLQTQGALHQVETPLTWRHMRPPLKDLRVWILTVMRRLIIRSSALCIVVNHECTGVLLHSKQGCFFSLSWEEFGSGGSEPGWTLDFNVCSKSVSWLNGNRQAWEAEFNCSKKLGPQLLWVYSIRCTYSNLSTTLTHIPPLLFIYKLDFFS